MVLGQQIHVADHDVGAHPGPCLTANPRGRRLQCIPSSFSTDCPPPGFHTTTREPKRAHLRVPVFKHHQNSTEGPPEREEKNEISGGRGKKRAKFWAPTTSGPHFLGLAPHPWGAPPFGPPPLRAPTPPGPQPSGPPPLRTPKIGQQKLAKCGQIRMAKFRFSQIRPRPARRGRGRRVRPQSWKSGPQGWVPEGWVAQNFALFFPSPATISLVSIWVSARGILVVVEAPEPFNVRVWSSWVVL